MNKKRIKLNIPCPVCKKEIYLGQETAHTRKGVYHLKCYLEKKNDKKQQVEKLENEFNFHKNKLTGDKISGIGNAIQLNKIKEIKQKTKELLLIVEKDMLLGKYEKYNSKDILELKQKLKKIINSQLRRI